MVQSDTIGFMIKLIIFDWDDVFVVGAKDGYLACYRRAIKDYGIQVHEDRLKKITREMWGQPNQKIISTLIEPANLNKLNGVIAHYKKYKRDETFLSHLHFIVGGQTFLQRISKNYTLAIATSQEKDVLLEYLFPKFQVPDVFSSIISSHDLADPFLAKPHPYMIKKLLLKYRLSPEQAVMVGDAENDIQMALNAGVEGVAVLTGHLNRKEAEELGVKHIIENVTMLESELVEIVIS